MSVNGMMVKPIIHAIYGPDNSFLLIDSYRLLILRRRLIHDLDIKGVYMDSLIQFVQDWRIRETAIIGDGGFVNRVLLREQAYRSKEMLKAYYLERKAIFDYETDGHISSQEANILRSQVNQLESFALKDATPSLSLVRMRRK